MDKPDHSLEPAHIAILDKLVDIARAAGPLMAQTDKYFTNTSRIVGAHGDTEVTFAGTHDSVKAYTEIGFQFLAGPTDTDLLRSGAAAYLEKVKG